MSPAISAAVTALDNAKQSLAILTAANETAAAQAKQAADYHAKTYSAVVQGTDAMKTARKALTDAVDAEYAVPDNTPIDGAIVAETAPQHDSTAPVAPATAPVDTPQPLNVPTADTSGQ